MISSFHIGRKPSDTFFSAASLQLTTALLPALLQGEGVGIYTSWDTMRLKACPTLTAMRLETGSSCPRIPSEDIASYQCLSLTQWNCASKQGGLRQSACWAEHLAGSPPPLLGVILKTTCRYPAFCAWASHHVNPFHALIWVYTRANPSASPLRTNPKGDTFAPSLCTSLKVWTLFDQLTWSAKKPWQPAWNFFSTVVSIYPGGEEKGGEWILLSIPLNNILNSKNIRLQNIIQCNKYNVIW